MNLNIQDQLCVIAAELMGPVERGGHDSEYLRGMSELIMYATAPMGDDLGTIEYREFIERRIALLRLTYDTH